MILAGFDRATMAMHAGDLSRQGEGHAGIILFLRSVSTLAYGLQARLLVEFVARGAIGDWADRIEYLPANDARMIAVIPR